MNHETLLAQGPVDVTVRCCSVDGMVVLPRYAYTRDEEWLGHFETTFPEKAKKMRAYSDRQGWGNWAHVRYWTQAALSWLSKNAAPNVEFSGDARRGAGSSSADRAPEDAQG